MSRYCLDTSAYSHFQRGDDRVIEILDRAEWLGVPVMTLGELRTGFLLGSQAEENESSLREFLANRHGGALWGPRPHVRRPLPEHREGRFSRPRWVGLAAASLSHVPAETLFAT